MLINNCRLIVLHRRHLVNQQISLDKPYGAVYTIQLGDRQYKPSLIFQTIHNLI